MWQPDGLYLQNLCRVFLSEFFTHVKYFLIIQQLLLAYAFFSVLGISIPLDDQGRQIGI